MQPAPVGREPMQPARPVSPSHAGPVVQEPPGASGPVVRLEMLGLPPARPGPMPREPEPPEALRAGPVGPEPEALRPGPVGPERVPVPGWGVGRGGAGPPVRAGVQREPPPGRSAPEQDRSMRAVRMRVDW